MKKFVLVFSLALLAGCSSGNLEDIKAHAPEVFQQAGFNIIGYEGYQRELWDPGIMFGFGGAHVWYTLNKIPSNGITYHAYIQKWGNENHIYSLKAIDAIGPK